MRLPTSTPSAVPGTMTRSTRSAGKPKTPIRSPEKMTKRPRLSSASPKNAFQSPGAHQRTAGAVLTGSGGTERARPGRGELARERAHPVREPAAPREAPAVLGHLGKAELHRGRGRRGSQAFAQAQADPVALPLAGSLGVHHRLDAQVLPLGVRDHEVAQPAGHLIVLTA